MKLFGLIFDNFGLKVLALVMAWAVWFTTRESLTETVELRMLVQVNEPESGEVVAHAEQETVKIKVSGPARSVATFEKRRLPVAEINIRPEHFPAIDQWETRKRFILEELNIPDLSETEDLRAVSMDPNVIEVKIEKIEEREVPVQVAALPAFSDRATAKIVVPPPNASVRGTLANLNKLGSSIRTSVSQQTLRNLTLGMKDAMTTTEPVELTIDPTQTPLFELVSPERLTAKIEISQVERQSVTVTVSILADVDNGTDGPRKLLFSDTNTYDERLEFKLGVDGAPSTMTLQLEGSPAAMERVNAKKIVAFVLVGDMPADRPIGTLPLHVAELPAGVRFEPVMLAVQAE